MNLFRLKLVSKRQVTIPQRLLDIIGLRIGDEIHLKVSGDKILQAYPVQITPDLEMSADAQDRFTEIEKERAASGRADNDLSDLMDQYSDGREGFTRRVTPAQVYSASRVAPRNFHRTDERIVELVAEGLAEAQLDVSDVEIFAEKSEVTLRGTMRDKKARLIAELVARNVLGVAEVDNQIEVTPRDLLKAGSPSEDRGIEKSTQQR
jgi:antitoxin component of MazEF toxin-antitoxin module